MKIIYNKYIPFGEYTVFNFFGILFTKLKKIPDVIINHEEIHTAQMKELLYIGFYIIYLIEWILFGYYNISFEKEAYDNMKDLNYLKSRKIFAMWRK